MSESYPTQPDSEAETTGPLRAPPFPYPEGPRGSRLPEALRVLLYLGAWFVLVNLVAGIPIVALIFWDAAQSGKDLEQVVRSSLEPSGNLLIAVIIIQGVVGFGAGMALLWVFGTLIDGRPVRSFGFERVRGWALQAGAGFLLDAGHMSAVFITGLLAGWYQVVAIAPPGQALLIFVLALLIALPAAAAEEVTMRGYVLQTLEGRYGPIWATAVNSGLFALMHLANPGGPGLLAVAGLILAGVYFSVAYLATRQLWLPIMGHAVWNVFEGPVYGLPVSGLEMPASILRVEVGGPTLWSGGRFGPEAGLVVVITTLAWIPLVWWVGRRLRARAEGMTTETLRH